MKIFDLVKLLIESDRHETKIESGMKLPKLEPFLTKSGNSSKNYERIIEAWRYWYLAQRVLPGYWRESSYSTIPEAEELIGLRCDPYLPMSYMKSIELLPPSTLLELRIYQHINSVTDDALEYVLALIKESNAKKGLPKFFETLKSASQSLNEYSLKYDTYDSEYFEVKRGEVNDLHWFFYSLLKYQITRLYYLISFYLVDYESENWEINEFSESSIVHHLIYEGTNKYNWRPQTIHPGLPLDMYIKFHNKIKPDDFTPITGKIRYNPTFERISNQKNDIQLILEELLISTNSNEGFLENDTDYQLILDRFFRFNAESVAIYNDYYTLYKNQSKPSRDKFIAKHFRQTKLNFEHTRDNAKIFRRVISEIFYQYFPEMENTLYAVFINSTFTLYQMPGEWEARWTIEAISKNLSAWYKIPHSYALSNLREENNLNEKDDEESILPF